MKDHNKSNIQNTSKKIVTRVVSGPQTIVISLKKSDLSNKIPQTHPFSKAGKNLSTNLSTTNTNASLNVKKR